jgi:hypothetical protein
MNWVGMAGILCQNLLKKSPKKGIYEEEFDDKFVFMNIKHKIQHYENKLL